MKLLIVGVLSLVSIISAVVYSGGQATAILADINGCRSKFARGIMPWRGFPLQPKLKYPASTKMFALKWDSGLATAASQRLDTLVFNPPDEDGFIIGNLSGKVACTEQPLVNEFWAGIVKGETAGNIHVQNRMPAMRMWNETWGWSLQGYPSDYWTIDPPFFNRYPGYEIYNGRYSFPGGANNIATVFDGGAQKIGCAYRNLTGIKKFAVLCQMTPNGLVKGSPLYPQGTPIGSGCPSTHPLKAATGLCTAP